MFLSHIRIYPIVRSLASYILPKKMLKRPGSGGTFSSKYCYSVWLRHLHYLISEKLIEHPSDLKNIAELGPGDSVGIGLAALFTGSEKYYAMDVIEHASKEKNIKICTELSQYFSTGLDIPHGLGFENTSPILNDYKFPEVLNDLSQNHVNTIENDIVKELQNEPGSSKSIEYIVPWDTVTHDHLNDQLDLIFSQAVMEHVDDIKGAYGAMFRWLKPGGIISHQVDFKTHEMTKEWNGHWFIGDKMWRFLSHGRKYPMNRLPLSAHISMIQEIGFKIKFILPNKKQNMFLESPKISGITFTSEDLITSGALILAFKPN